MLLYQINRGMPDELFLPVRGETYTVVFWWPLQPIHLPFFREMLECIYPNTSDNTYGHKVNSVFRHLLFYRTFIIIEHSHSYTKSSSFGTFVTVAISRQITALSPWPRFCCCCSPSSPLFPPHLLLHRIGMNHLVTALHLGAQLIALIVNHWEFVLYAFLLLFFPIWR